MGDPDQAIYTFAGADGKILERLSANRTPLHLSLNFRSNNNIVQAIKGFSSIENMTSVEENIPQGYGAFVTAYSANDESTIIAKFTETLDSLNLDTSNSAVLFRGRGDCRRLRGENLQGAATGIMPHFMKAACYRETGDMGDAYKELTMGIFNLMSCSEDIKRNLTRNPSDEVSKRFRRLVWVYLRANLPSALLQGKSAWHPTLISSLEAFLPEVSTIFSLQQPDQLGRKLQNRNFLDQPMFDGTQQNIRIDTVHQAKGETLDAVLFFVKKKQLQSLFSNNSSEEKRITYVAMTRAKSLLWLAIPQDCTDQYMSQIEAKGFLQLN